METESGTTVRADDLRRFVSQILEKLKVPSEDAVLVAEHLVDSDMRGIGTHGVMRLPLYSQYLKEGYYNARPNIRIVNESPVHALFDGDAGMGFIVSTRAMDWCIERAKQNGFGMAGVRNSRHNGAAGAYAMMAARQDLIGFASTGVIPLMAPPGGLLATHGNNPICFAMPTGSEPMFVHDMATSEKAWGNVLNYRREGKRMPVGWALDSDGNPTDDPEAAASLVPIGDGGIKGFGLAVAFDILCGVMTGANFARRFDPNRLDEDVGHFFFAIDPSLFMPLEEYKERIDETLREIRTAPRRTGIERIYISGEIEALAKERAQRDGISLPPVLVRQLQELGEQLGINLDG